MKRHLVLMNGLVILSLALLLFTYLDWASLHDISNEFVSLRILEYLGITLSEPLPDWVNTRGEWVIVRIALVARIIFFLLTAVTVGYLIRKWPATAD